MAEVSAEVSAKTQSDAAAGAEAMQRLRIEIIIPRKIYSFMIDYYYQDI
jgi:hypothetical protein